MELVSFFDGFKRRRFEFELVCLSVGAPPVAAVAAAAISESLEQARVHVAVMIL